ncbi:hypothetical protein INT45_008112 [Circinella minor]|uniref:Uncharacterized protein n=1 Tax=Circinella minor TaxID=1195481 RepID=A0A8H7RX74_9FUNG|nr:hypothetical protein INT45_008112 [Circinella minor]
MTMHVNGLSDYFLSDNDWEFINQLQQFFLPFIGFQKKMPAQKYPTINKAVTSYNDNNDDSTSILLKHQKLPSPHLTQARKEPKYDKNTAITLASSTFLGSTREKENSIMLAKIGNLEPVTLKNKNGKKYHFLTSPENIGQVLTDQPSGPWTLPADNEQVQSSSSSKTEGILDHIINTDMPPRKSLQGRSWLMNQGLYLSIAQNHMEYRRELMPTLNEELLRHYIIHHFQRKQQVTDGLPLLLRMKTTQKKLQLSPGFCTGGFWLETSAKTGGNYSMAKNVMVIGSNTSNFTATEDAKIYLNMESLILGKALAEDEAAFSIDVGSYFYQLRQLRSKFHCLSTYTLCRSSSTFAYDISFRPYTIWTFCDYDSAQQVDSQSQLLSRFFQTVATSVIKNREMSQIKLKNLNDLHDKLKDGAIKFAIREFLGQQEDESFPVMVYTSIIKIRKYTPEEIRKAAHLFRPSRMDELRQTQQNERSYSQQFDKVNKFYKILQTVNPKNSKQLSSPCPPNHNSTSLIPYSSSCHSHQYH